MDKESKNVEPDLVLDGSAAQAERPAEFPRCSSVEKRSEKSGTGGPSEPDPRLTPSRSEPGSGDEEEEVLLIESDSEEADSEEDDIPTGMDNEQVASWLDQVEPEIGSDGESELLVEDALLGRSDQAELEDDIEDAGEMSGLEGVYYPFQGRSPADMAMDYIESESESETDMALSAYEMNHPPHPPILSHHKQHEDEVTTERRKDPPMVTSERISTIGHREAQRDQELCTDEEEDGRLEIQEVEKAGDEAWSPVPASKPKRQLRGKRRHVISVLTSEAHANYSAMRNIIVKKKRTYARGKRRRRLQPPPPPQLRQPEQEYEGVGSSEEELEGQEPPPPAPPKRHLFPNLTSEQILEYFGSRGQLIVMPQQRNEGESEAELSGLSVPPPANPHMNLFRRLLTAERNAARAAERQENLENIPIPLQPKIIRQTSALFVNASDSREVKQQWYDRVRLANHPSPLLPQAHVGGGLSVSAQEEAQPSPDLPAPETAHNVELGLEEIPALSEPVSLANLDMDVSQSEMDQYPDHVLIDMDPPPAKDVSDDWRSCGGRVYPRPPIPYSSIIVLALKNSLTGTLPVSQVYKFCCDHFPYFRTAPSGWKNSIRHNLSLNKAFMKVDHEGNMSEKGRRAFLWMLDERDSEKKLKLERELHKLIDKPPSYFAKTMSDPENFPLLLRGELKRDYRSAQEEEDEDQIQSRAIAASPPPEETGAAFTGTVSQMRAFLQQQHSNSLTMLSLDSEEDGVSIVEPIGLGGMLSDGQGQFLHQISEDVYRISSFPETHHQHLHTDSVPLILRRATKTNN